MVGVLAAAALCVIGTVAAIGVASDRSLQRPDWRAVAHALGPRPPAAGRVILIQEYRTLLPLSLYTTGLHFWRRQPSETVREFDVVTIGAPRVKLCWWGAACNLTPSAAQATYPIPGFVEVSRRRAYQFTVIRMLARRPATLTHALVAQALTATRLSHDGLIVQR
jgi:hypothetical protein